MLKRRFLGFVLAVCMLFSLIPSAAYADREEDPAIRDSDSSVAEPVREETPSPTRVDRQPSDGVPDALRKPEDPVLLGISIMAEAHAPSYLQAPEPSYTTDISVAGGLLRERMKQHEETVQVFYQFQPDNPDDVDAEAEVAADAIYHEAIRHTGISNEGDYLLWSLSSSTYFLRVTITDEGTCLLEVIYYFWYYTTAEQEAELMQLIEELKPQLRLDEELSDYEKLTNIYYYICDNVTYDYEHLGDMEYGLQQTAYAALKYKTSVCQGYATLLYLLALEAGIDCRILVGWAGELHAWNIVQLDGLYYFLDSTWDAGRGDRWWYLLSREEFVNHTEDSTLLEDDFYENHPFSPTSYDHPELLFQTEGSFTYHVISGRVTVVEYNGTDRHVVVPATLGGYPVYQIASSCFYGNDTMETLTFSEGIVYLGSYAIFNCYTLKKLTLPSTMQLLVYDDYYTPSSLTMSIPVNCNDLREIVVAEGNPSVCIDDNILYSADREALVFLPPADPRTTLHVPEGVRLIAEQALHGNCNLQKVILSDTVEAIGPQAFRDTVVTSLSIPAALTYIDPFALGMNCPLQTITVHPDNPVYVADDSALYERDGDHRSLVKYLTGNEQSQFAVPDGVVTIFPYAFFCSTHLEQITLPDSVKYIEDFAFEGCCELQSITLSNQLRNLGYRAFFDCTKLQYIEIPASVVYVDSYCFATGNSATSVVFLGDAPQTMYSPFDYDLPATAYYPCGNATWTDEVRQSCGENVSWSILHAADGEGVVTEATCSAPGYTSYTCQTCGQPYRANLVAPLDHTYENGSCNVCGAGPVAQRGSYSDLLFWELSADSVLTITGLGTIPETFSVLSQYADVTSVVIRDGVSAIGDRAFSRFYNLSSVTIPDSVTSIGNDAFLYCYELDSVTIPDGVTSIGREAFFYCYDLDSVTISDSVTTIGDWAFFYCIDLTSVTIPDSVTSIGAEAFRSCDALKTITFAGDCPDMAGDAWLYTTATAFYPCGNATWTADTLQNYGGTLTWQAYHTLGTAVITPPTCVDPGCTTYTCPCGKNRQEEAIPATGEHTYENGVCTVCGITGSISDIAVEAVGEIGYTVSGSTVTVTHDIACKVGYLVDGVYVKISGTMNPDGSYSFTAPEGVTEVLVVISGDVNGNGSIQAADKSRLNAALLKKTTLSAKEIFAADVNDDGQLLAADKSRLNAVLLKKTTLTW